MIRHVDMLQLQPAGGDVSNKRSFETIGTDDPFMKRASTAFTAKSNPNDYKSFTDKCMARCRADTHIVQKFNSGSVGRKEAFQLFMQVHYNVYSCECNIVAFFRSALFCKHKVLSTVCMHCCIHSIMCCPAGRW